MRLLLIWVLVLSLSMLAGCSSGSTISPPGPPAGGAAAPATGASAGTGGSSGLAGLTGLAGLAGRPPDARTRASVLQASLTTGATRIDDLSVEARPGR